MNNRTPIPDVILASGSRFRAAMLEAAGVPVAVDPPAVDEDAVKAAMRATDADAAETAEALAALKAQQVSSRRPGALVIGADQMLECDGAWFDKPADRAQARQTLLALRGRTHELVTAVCVVRDGLILWHHVARARLTMRVFGDAFLDSYLKAIGSAACDSVGAYQLEGLGAQLFSRIEGDHFTIVGLPLLPLLDFLRGHGVIGE
ncbi:MAG: Maf family protein [Alphaproteobacteria bacterium]|nr:Maf family protein [Alphaproteobacteria bacterium]